MSNNHFLALIRLALLAQEMKLRWRNFSENISYFVFPYWVLTRGGGKGQWHQDTTPAVLWYSRPFVWPLNIISGVVARGLFFFSFCLNFFLELLSLLYKEKIPWHNYTSHTSPSRASRSPKLCCHIIIPRGSYSPISQAHLLQKKKQTTIQPFWR